MGIVSSLTDSVFSRKTLQGDWSLIQCTCKANHLAQVFANKPYFSRIYAMDLKMKAGDALRLFCQEFGVLEKLTFGGSKEQGCRLVLFISYSYSCVCCVINTLSQLGCWVHVLTRTDGLALDGR